MNHLFGHFDPERLFLDEYWQYGPRMGQNERLTGFHALFLNLQNVVLKQRRLTSIVT